MVIILIEDGGNIHFFMDDGKDERRTDGRKFLHTEFPSSLFMFFMQRSALVTRISSFIREVGVLTLNIFIFNVYKYYCACRVSVNILYNFENPVPEYNVLQFSWYLIHEDIQIGREFRCGTEAWTTHPVRQRNVSKAVSIWLRGLSEVKNADLSKPSTISWNCYHLVSAIGCQSFWLPASQIYNLQCACFLGIILYELHRAVLHQHPEICRRQCPYPCFDTCRNPWDPTITVKSICRFPLQEQIEFEPEDSPYTIVLLRHTRSTCPKRKNCV